MPVNAAGIPAALRQLVRWLVWRYVKEIDPETGEVDWDKPPLCARGGPVSSTNSRTWSTFAEALTAYQGGDFDGIGFVLYHKDGDDSPVLIAIDLDYCRDPETGIIALWAQEIIHNINSYAEVSPSGEGVRIFLFGILPPTGRKKGDYENYQTGRYVTVTGQHLEGTPTTIEHRQAELEQVHRRIWPAPPAATHPTPKGVGHSGVRLDDAEIIRRAAAAKNGTKFTQLWRGDTGGYCTHSEADLALCNYLAFWVGPDQDRIADLFAQSGLYRSKWNRKDYRQRTIDRALAGRTEYYGQRREGAVKTNGGWGNCLAP